MENVSENLKNCRCNEKSMKGDLIYNKGSSLK